MQSDINRKLSFVAVGPQRTASTWIDESLRASGLVALPNLVKETFFFDESWSKGLTWYWSHFSKKSIMPVFGEVAPSYFDVEECPQRIFKLYPDCRIVITLRDPADRVFSLFLHHLRKGRVPRDLRQAINVMPRILSSSHYRQHVERWIERFGESNVLVLRHEDIEVQGAIVLQRLEEFLGLPLGHLSTYAVEGRVNSASLPKYPRLARVSASLVVKLKEKRLHRVVEFGKRLGLKQVYRGEANLPKLECEERKWLVDQLEDDIRYCADKFAWNVDPWLK